MPDAAIAGDAAMPALTEWIGRARVTEEEITLAAARRVAATLDHDPDALRPGSSLPSHWSGLFFAEVARHAALGPDGHPRKGEFLPPIPLPHRMGAGRRVLLHGGLRVREDAEKAFREKPQVVVVASSTLEIGIDVGDVDLVVLDAPPPDIASLLQRIGRGSRRRGTTRVLACSSDARHPEAASAARGRLVEGHPRGGRHGQLSG